MIVTPFFCSIFADHKASAILVRKHPRKKLANNHIYSTAASTDQGQATDLKVHTLFHVSPRFSARFKRVHPSLSYVRLQFGGIWATNLISHKIESTLTGYDISFLYYVFWVFPHPLTTRRVSCSILPRPPPVPGVCTAAVQPNI